MKTDGFICDSSDDEAWAFQNTGDAGPRPQLSPYASAYVRVERCGAIAGTKVSESGKVSNGPVVSFTDPNGLLAGAAAAAGFRPWIVWAGVSPLSLSEILIVWNKPIALLSRAKIVGAKVTTVVGRLMIVQMEKPVAIHGGKVFNLEIQAGALGVYDDGGPPCPAKAPQPDEQGGGGGQLGELCALPDDCGCGDVYPQGQADGGTGGGAGRLSPLWSTMCNPDAQCGEVQDRTAQFVTNNGMRVPVRCCHPFVLIQAYNCGESGDCACQPAQVWQASMSIYGTTLPLDLLGLDNLLDIEPCCIAERWSNGYPAVLLNDMQCSPDCKTQFSVEIVAAGGPPVVVTGYWTPKINGYAGQSVLWRPPCNRYCDDPNLNCVPLIMSDEVDCYVAEDIIKPIERTSPVSFFEDFILTTQEFTIYETTTVGFKETSITGYKKLPDPVVVTQYKTTDESLPNWELGDPVNITKFSTVSKDVVTDIETGTTNIPNIDCDTAVNVVTSVGVKTGPITGISTVLTDDIACLALDPAGAVQMAQWDAVLEDLWRKVFVLDAGALTEQPDMTVVTSIATVDGPWLIYKDIEQWTGSVITSVHEGRLRPTNISFLTDAETQTQIINLPQVGTPVNAATALAVSQQVVPDFMAAVTEVFSNIHAVANITPAEPTPAGTALTYTTATLAGFFDAVTAVSGSTTPVNNVSPALPVNVVTDVSFTPVNVTGVVVGAALQVVTSVGHTPVIIDGVTPLTGDVVTDVISAGGMDVVVSLTNTNVDLATGLSFAVAKDFVIGPAVVVTELEFATITACIAGVPAPLAVATGFKTATLNAESFQLATALALGPVALPIAPQVSPITTDWTVQKGQVVTGLEYSPAHTVVGSPLSIGEGSITAFTPATPVEVAASVSGNTRSITGVQSVTPVNVVTSLDVNIGSAPDLLLGVANGLSTAPVTGVVVGTPVNVVTSVWAALGTPANLTFNLPTGVNTAPITGISADTTAVALVTNVVTKTDSLDVLIDASAELPEEGDIVFINQLDMQAHTFYPQAAAFDKLYLDHELVILPITDVVAATEIPDMVKVKDSPINVPTEVVLSPPVSVVTEVSGSTRSIIPAKCDGTRSVVTSVVPKTGSVKSVEQDGTPVQVREINKLDDLVVKVIGTETETFDIPDFEEEVKDVLVRDDEGEDSFVVMNPDAFEVYKALIPDDAGDITCITSTDPGCAVTYKFLNHDGVAWKWTQAPVTPGDCCNKTGPSSNADVQPMNIEVDCKNFLVLSGKYVGKPAGTENRCPCYDGSAELACEQPGSNDVEEQGGGPRPCTMKVRRIRRQFCVECNPTHTPRDC
jgi:hypothetical protein